MNLVDVLTRQAEARPRQLALVEPGRRGRQITFEALHDQVGKRGAGLAAAGCRPGDRLLLWHPVSIPLYIDLLAVMRAGMQAVLIDPSQAKDFADSCLKRARPAGMLGHWTGRLLRLFRKPWRQIPWITLPPASAAAETVSVTPDTPALLTFTSGSTGRPKGVVRTHGLLLAQQRALAKALDHQPDERDLVTLPVFVLANLASGITSIIADSPLKFPAEADPSRIHAQIERWHINRLSSSPAFLEALIRRGQRYPCIRKIHTGGAPVFPSLLGRLPKHFPQARITTVYGSTEAEPIAHWHGDAVAPAILDRIGAGSGLPAGKPVPEVALAVIGNQWGMPVEAPLRRLPAGEPGEIVVSGDHVVPAYLNDEGNDETKIFTEGRIWHRTGDAGYLDDHGGLWLLGRAGEVCRSPGRPDAYPLAVEGALSQWPEISRCAFLQQNDKRLLVLEGASPPDLCERIRPALAWAGIDAIVSIDKIPLDRRHQAKINYPALRNRLATDSSSL